VQLLDFSVGIDFGIRGNLREFSPAGFSTNADDSSTWTEQMTAELSFRVPPLRSDLRVTIEATPFIAERSGIAEQDCWIFLNGLFVQFHKLRDSAEIILNLSRDQFALRGNRLSFVLPNAASPYELGIGDDIRLLGLAFTRLTAKP
jgi:hypothetical protein